MQADLIIKDSPEGGTEGLAPPSSCAPDYCLLNYRDVSWQN